MTISIHKELCNSGEEWKFWIVAVWLTVFLHNDTQGVRSKINSIDWWLCHGMEYCSVKENQNKSRDFCTHKAAITKFLLHEWARTLYLTSGVTICQDICKFQMQVQIHQFLLQLCSWNRWFAIMPLLQGLKLFFFNTTNTLFKVAQ